MLLQWIVLIVARILQISSHDYETHIGALRAQSVALQRLSRIANAGQLYNPNLIVNGFLSDIGGNYAHLRTFSTIDRGRLELENAMNEANRAFHAENVPDMVVDVFHEIEEIFSWELYLQDDIQAMRTFNDVIKDLHNTIQKLNVLMVPLGHHQCFTEYAESQIAQNAKHVEKQLILEVDNLYLNIESGLDTWCLDFLNPISSSNNNIEFENTALIDAIQNHDISSLTSNQQAVATKIMGNIALATSVVANVLFTMGEDQWRTSDDDRISHFIQNVVLQSTRQLEPLIQRRSQMNLVCPPRSMITVLGHRTFLFH